MKRVILILLSICLFVVLSIPAFSEGRLAGKEEVVYGMLGLDGSVEKIYVVNIFKNSVITDYGDYTDIKNLTNADAITQNGDEITINSSADHLFYQGTLKTQELPWRFDIAYTLNGQEMKPAALAGMSGQLKIRILVTKNINADSLFFDNFALQIALTLNTNLCDNISAAGATAANAGIAKHLSYIILPGNGADITVFADVHDFQMAAIELSGIKLNLNMEIDSTAFSNQITELTDAIAVLDDGAGSLADGVNQLKTGMTQYLAGFSTYKEGLAALSGGAEKISSGVSALDSGLKELTIRNDLLVSGALSIRQATFDTVNKQLSGMNLPALTPDNYSQILSGNKLLAPVQAQLDGIVQFYNGVIAYTSGVSLLETGASDLSGGAATLSSSLSQAVSGAQDLFAGAVTLGSAVDAVNTGLDDYKGGTAKLRDSTAGMDAKIAGMISGLLAKISGGDEIKSFVSDKNTQVSSVQFIMKTGAIEILKVDDNPSTEVIQPTLWERLLALFGIN
jgi:putative membrane protein